MPMSKGFASTVRANFGPGSATDHHLRQKYVGHPPRNQFYQLMYNINGLKPTALLGLCALISFLVLLSLSGLYTGLQCYDAAFHENILISFLSIMGASSEYASQTEENRAACGIVISLNALLQVAFKSIVFAVMVKKLTKVTPKLYFTPVCVISFRDGHPVLLMKIMSAQGTLLELLHIQAQWVFSHTTDEGEHFCDVKMLKMKSFLRMRSPTTLSHKIDSSSPLFGEDLENLRGAIFVTAHFWDPANQREVRHSTRYSLPEEYRFNHRFADLATKTHAGHWAADVSLYGVTVPLDASVQSMHHQGEAVETSQGNQGLVGAAHKYALVLPNEQVKAPTPWYIPDWNDPNNISKLHRGRVTLLIGARFFNGRLVPRCDFSAFVEMCMCECGIEYDRYLLDLDSKSTYVRHLPEEMREKNIPFLHDGRDDGGWSSLSVSCMKAAMATKPDATAVFVKTNPKVPEYDHKKFSNACMDHLTQPKGTPDEMEALKSVKTFLRQYEEYFEESGHKYLGGATGLSFMDCQLIPHVSALVALWRRVKGTSMLEGFPNLRRWHDELICRNSFRKTWPQGYSLDEAVNVVAQMSLEKAQTMYGFRFPDLAGDRKKKQYLYYKQAAISKKQPQAKDNTDIKAFCL